jgi:16S rRNA (uracil1498-N3)-methyltransferase
MSRFFISGENIQGNHIFISNKSDIKHITNVLRFVVGDVLILVEEDAAEYKAEILEINPNSIKTEIISKTKSNRKLNLNITLAQSILKSQKQDIVIQKATELGVRTIIPFISRNTVVKMESDKDKNQKIQRWQKIAYESVKQCQRMDIPQINPVISINELMDLNNFDVMIACVERDAESSIKTCLQQNRDKIGSNILIIIGPEGGWDDKELKLFKERGVAAASLGNMILRAETASIAAISDVIYEYEL